MKIYQRRNPKVEAMQFAKEEDYFDIAKWVYSDGGKCSLLRNEFDEPTFDVGGIGNMSLGDWIVKEVDDNFHILNDNDFNRKFERIPGGMKK